MSMPDPLRDPFYEFGHLMQQCDRCGWTVRGHVVELVACPDCSALLQPPLAIEFGGLRAIWTGKTFRVADREGKPIHQLYEADMAGLLPFLCRHAPDYRRGRPPTHVYTERYTPLLTPWR
jgi:hypothetical protein